MVTLISLHWIDSFAKSSKDNIDEINQIKSKHTRSCRDFSTRYDSKCRNKKCKHNRPRIPHHDISPTISNRQEKRRWQNNRQNQQNKSTIFLCSNTRICQVQFDREHPENQKSNRRNTTRHTWNSVRKIDGIEDERIPKNRDEYRQNIHRHLPITKKRKSPKNLVQLEDTSKNMAHIRNLDTRQTDKSPYTNLH